VLIAIPAFDEERFIGSVVAHCRLLGYPVLVIDDGSTDATAEIATMAGAIVERHGSNQGKSAALNTAFRVANQQGVEALVVLDGDGQHNCDEIPRLLAPILSDQADIVIGSRFLNGSTGHVPAVRRLGQRAITGIANLASGLSVTDSQSGFRAFSARAIASLGLHSQGFGAEVEMQFQARTHGLRVIEAPISAFYDDAPKRNVISHGLQVMNRLLALVEQNRPLLFFGLPGLFLLLVGLGFGVLVTHIYEARHELAIGYGLITVLTAIAGLLCLLTSLMLHAIRLSFMEIERRLRNPRG
jgi:glycosyltransferase involved in cell wall biosynthesis